LTRLRARRGSQWAEQARTRARTVLVVHTCRRCQGEMRRQEVFAHVSAIGVGVHGCACGSPCRSGEKARYKLDWGKLQRRSMPDVGLRRWRLGRWLGPLRLLLALLASSPLCPRWKLGWAGRHIFREFILFIYNFNAGHPRPLGIGFPPPVSLSPPPLPPTHPRPRPQTAAAGVAHPSL